MINFKFLFKLDLIDISSIDFYFSDRYETLETDPILTKRYPTVGTVAYGAVYMPVENEEVEELPNVFYAEAVINFNDNTSIKAHARTLKNQEALLTTILNDGDEDIDVKFHIDESSDGGVSYNAGNGIDISNDTISTKIAEQSYLSFGNDNSLRVEPYALGLNESIRQSLGRPDYPNALATHSSLLDMANSKQDVITSKNQLNADLVTTNGTSHQFLPGATQSHEGNFLTWAQNRAWWVRLNADQVHDGSNYIVVPKPTSNDAGKILQVNSNGQPEWVDL